MSARPVPLTIVALMAAALATACGATGSGGTTDGRSSLDAGAPDADAAGWDGAATGDGPALPGAFDLCGSPARLGVEGVTTLLEVSHDTAVAMVGGTPDRLMSVDSSGRWILWDVARGAQVASGAIPPEHAWLRGGLLLSYSSGGADGWGGWDVLSVGEGRPLFSFSGGYGDRGVGLAVDGSYVWYLSADRARIYGPDGAVLLDVPFLPPLAPGMDAETIRSVAGAAAGLQVLAGPTPHVESIGLDGSVRVGAPYAGSFRTWFDDGQRFITTDGDGLVRVYATPDVLQHAAPLDGMVVAGAGELFATWGPAACAPGPCPRTLSVFRVGEAAPLRQYEYDDSWLAWPLGDGRIMVAQGEPGYDSAELDVIVLGLAPGDAQRVGLPDPTWRLMRLDGQGWVAADGDGGIYLRGLGGDGAPRPLGCGAVRAVAGSPGGVAAIAAGSHRTFVFDAAGGAPALGQDLALAADALAVAADGSVLGAIYSAPKISLDGSTTTVALLTRSDGALLHSWTHPTMAGETSPEFVVSGEGDAIVQRLKLDEAAAYVRVEADGTEAWRVAPCYACAEGSEPGVLSLDGSWLAISDECCDPGSTTLYADGVVAARLPGVPAGFLADDQLLLNTYECHRYYRSYAGALLFAPREGTLRSVPLPEVGRFDPAGPGRLYSRTDGRIYDVETGAVVWSRSDLPPGRIAGEYVVAVSGRQVIAARY